MKTTLYLLIFSMVCAGCGSTYSEKEINEFDKKIQSYLDEKGIECEKSPSGLYYKIEKEGTGPQIQYTDQITFTYRGELLNGKVFDEQKDPVNFDVKVLIGAWKEAALMSKKGAKLFLIAPPQLGYGTHQLNAIPESSILIFEMNIVDVK